ncbi:helix-turn-helix domain-containing protein [Vibrio sp. RM-44-3]|uniref:phage repressor protein CI n=1 Tax=Vibrio TaxID=662 RepID=UPI00215BE480|nr:MULTISPECIES: phage repressor protein CI [Vibrio]ELB2854483.1 phage repressor protein CI [Vibrio alginolyticus]MDG2722494.1 phage repressor protein CI [Vibrio parahaemolyticus]ELH9637723.1 phage repressor protein CI [Vibrio alginolyticus]EMA9139182.1 phage repressor protein CI [Vibrio alginolyticus]MCR9550628.1 helix-turn-helix domain-containing protein [Vibrio sp. RM-41-2A]
MSKIPAKVPAFDYLKGRDFTEKLKEVTGCSTFDLVADHYGVPKSTFFTWHTHNRTGFELIVREHLASGASVRYLALGQGEPFPKSETPSATNSIEKFSIVNGKLEQMGTVELGFSTLNEFGLVKENLIIIEQNGRHLYVNKAESQPASGDYLLDIDGVLSINYLQRLPGKKLVIAFDTSTIEVSEEDIKVIGRVSVEMKKK